MPIPLLLAGALTIVIARLLSQLELRTASVGRRGSHLRQGKDDQRESRDAPPCQCNLNLASPARQFNDGGHRSTDRNTQTSSGLAKQFHENGLCKAGVAGDRWE